MRGVGVPHHTGKDIGIEHPVHRYVIGARLETGYPSHRVDQGFAVMRTGPADQRAIDVEQHQGRRRRRRPSIYHHRLYC